MISNCGHDERGKYSGGKAGDQTGTEWYIRSWYNHNWKCVIRFPENVREQLALNAEKAAKNNLIGYDQNERLTYYNHLKASNWDASKITVACEADCSAGVSANIIAAGYKLGIDKLKNFNKSNTTSTLRNACKAVGATILTDSKYLTSDAYLLRGDLILKDGSHVTTNITNGSKANVSTSTPSASTPSKPSTSNSSSSNVNKYYLANSRVSAWQKAMNKGFDTNELVVDGKFGTASQTFASNHILSANQKHNCITAINFLRKTLHDTYGFSKLPTTGKWDSYLTTCVKVFQKNRGLTQDGAVGLVTTYFLLKGGK